MHKYPIQTTSPRTRRDLAPVARRATGSAQVNTVRRKTYKQYQPEDITAALYLVATSQASIIQAAKQFNIPTRTLYQKIYNIKKLYATPSSGLRFSIGERATSVLVPNESENGCVNERDVDHGGETRDLVPDPFGIWRPLPEGQRVGPEHIVIKLEPYLLSEVLDPPRVDSSITNVATTKECSFVSSFDEFKVNELGGFATSQPVDSEGLKNLMLTLHTSSLQIQAQRIGTAQ